MGFSARSRVLLNGDSPQQSIRQPCRDEGPIDW
jgi:hypothetical protein